MGKEVHYKDINSKFLKMVIAIGAVGAVLLSIAVAILVGVSIGLVTAIIATIVIAVVAIALLIVMPIALIVGRAKKIKRENSEIELKKV